MADHVSCISLKKANGFPGLKSAHFFKPYRIGKMVQSHKRMDAVLNYPQDFRTVMLHRFVVKYTFGRLYPTPFNPEPVITDAHFGHQLKIFIIKLPVLICTKWRGTIPDMSRCL